jgi:hypothetical protein
LTKIFNIITKNGKTASLKKSSVGRWAVKITDRRDRGDEVKDRGRDKSGG